MWRKDDRAGRKLRILLAAGFIVVGHCLAIENSPALGADVSGTWLVDDPNAHYTLTLKQEGDRVTGSYGLQGGQVSGIFRDGVLRLNWKQDQNRRGGGTVLTLSPDGQVLSGSWQYDPKVFNSGLTGSGTWAFRRSADNSSTTSRVAPSPDKPPVLTRPQPASLTFDQFNAGPVSAGIFVALSARISALQGTLLINNAGPEMVLPAGHNRVFMIGGGPVTSITFSFDRPLKKFGLTRIGVINNASIPTWKLEALDGSGRVLDSIGEVHGLYQQSRQVFVQGTNIITVRLSTDNRYGSGTWATYNSLPVVEFQLERMTSLAGPEEKSPTAPPLATATPRITPSPPSPQTPTPPRVTASPPTPVSPTPRPTAPATPTPTAVAATPRPPSPTATPSPEASVINTKNKPPVSGALGKPEAVIAAVKKTAAPSPSGGHDEPIADGAFVVRRPDSWEVADTTDNSAMFVSQDLPNAGVKFEWDSKQPAAADEARELRDEHPDLELLPEGQIGSAPARRYAWVESAEPERREALQLSWMAGTTAMRATAIAPAIAWQKYPEKIIAVLNGHAGEKRTSKPKPKPTPTETPTPTPSTTPGVSATPSPTPTETPPPKLWSLKVAGVVTSKKLAPSAGEVQKQTIADGALTIRHDDSWRVSDSAASYTVLAAVKSPELTVWIQWSDGKGKSLDQLADDAAAKLRARYAAVESLPNRTIAGAPARQVAWLAGEGEETRENLQLDWIVHDTLFRATIAAPPEVWQKQGAQVLRLLEDLSEGGE
ncbi:MAG: hypothetical protein QOD12_1409 [Verrucomicrobiota bacterium]|jgi:hypothetical protein